jgi:uncharacterized protein YutD
MERVSVKNDDGTETTGYAEATQNPGTYRVLDDQGMATAEFDVAKDKYKIEGDDVGNQDTDVTETFRDHLRFMTAYDKDSFKGRFDAIMARYDARIAELVAEGQRLRFDLSSNSASASQAITRYISIAKQFESELNDVRGIVTQTFTELGQKEGVSPA